MSFGELLRTALHSLRINPIRSALAIMGVVFGVAAVVVLISMGQGVRSQISDQIRSMGSDLLIVKSGREEAAEDRDIRPAAGTAQQVSTSNLTEGDVSRVLKIKEYIKGATGTIEQLNKVESVGVENPKALNVKVVGGDSNFQEVRKLSFQYTAADWTFSKQVPRTCAIGYVVKKSLFGENAKNSDVVDKKKIKIGTIEFTIKAIASKRERSLFVDPNREIYISLQDAREVFGAENTDKVLEIYTKAKEASGVNKAKAEITEAIDAGHRKELQTSDPNAKYEMDFYVATQEDLMSSYNKILSILNALVIGVALVALIESGIGVSNIMYIAVKERTREIGVRLAQGASSRAILTQFLFESVTLCLVGAAIGIPLGWIVSSVINSFTVLPAQTPLWGVFVAFIAATIVGVAAGVYPAWKATKADIAVVLRAE